MRNIDEQCPTNDFHQGDPNGKCWGDGHYDCKNCKNYREDFKRLGQEFVNFAHSFQGQIRIETLKK